MCVFSVAPSQIICSLSPVYLHLHFQVSGFSLYFSIPCLPLVFFRFFPANNEGSLFVKHSPPLHVSAFGSTLSPLHGLPAQTVTGSPGSLIFQVPLFSRRFDSVTSSTDHCPLRVFLTSAALFVEVSVLLQWIFFRNNFFSVSLSSS